VKARAWKQYKRHNPGSHLCTIPSSVIGMLLSFQNLSITDTFALRQCVLSAPPEP
jgi:hypothetical protein